MEEPDDRIYFEFSATLRIHGEIDDLDTITREMGLRPTHVHRKGQTSAELRGQRQASNAKRFNDDAWHYSADIPRDAPLDMHIQALWSDIAIRRDYLLRLKSHLRVDVFCSCRSNSDTAGFEISPASLAIFIALDVPLGVSVIIA